jgi:peptidoglycan/LPS O-acetylase OafA/YrhL
MMCVAWQHGLSISGIEPRPIFGRLNIGQLGVTIFCALSGYFVMHSQDRPYRWLWRRLNRLYVPYWITLIAMFSANQVVGYKPVSWTLVVSEFLGIAYFTHPGEILGVHVWFISLILLCYGIAFAIRWNRWLLPACVPLAALAMLWNPFLAQHLLSFLAGTILAVTRRKCVSGGGLALITFVATATAGGGFVYPLAGTIALFAGGLVPGASPRVLAAASTLTYEFFLIHGPVYLLLGTIVGCGFLETITVGTLIAAPGSLLLHRISLVAPAAIGHFRSRVISAISVHIHA